MKCLYCDTDNTYKERAAKHACKKCARPFAFEPRDMPAFPITDRAFMASINAVSDKGARFYTPRQLYYQVIRQRAKPGKAADHSRRGLLLFWVIGVLVLVLFALFGHTTGLIVGLTLGGAIIGLGYLLRRLLVPPSAAVRKRAPAAPIPYQVFQESILARWERVHGPPTNMLPEGGRARTGAREGARETDIAQYSFDRLLVCDSDETADMLVANNLHFETNTPIISLAGYPADAFARVMEMVRRNPALTVFTLHDADNKGCLLPLRLREDCDWFPQPSVTIIDIGLRPRHVATMPGLIRTRGGVRSSLPAELTRMLTPGERTWLAAGERVELAVFKPSRLMRAIYQTFNRTAEEAERARQMAAGDPRGFFATSFAAPDAGGTRPRPERV